MIFRNQTSFCCVDVCDSQTDDCSTHLCDSQTDLGTDDCSTHLCDNQTDDFSTDLYHFISYTPIKTIFAVHNCFLSEKLMQQLRKIQKQKIQQKLSFDLGVS